MGESECWEAHIAKPAKEKDVEGPKAMQEYCEKFFDTFHEPQQTAEE